MHHIHWARLPPLTRAKSWSRLSARSVLQKASGLLRSPQATRTSLHSCAEQPDRQNFAKSSLPACPVLLRCRSARKLFLPDFLRRMASSWCALIVAALLRKKHINLQPIMLLSRYSVVFVRSCGLSKMQRGSFLKVVPTPYTNLKGYF